MRNNKQITVNSKNQVKMMTEEGWKWVSLRTYLQAYLRDMHSRGKVFESAPNKRDLEIRNLALDDVSEALDLYFTKDLVRKIA